MPSGKEPGEGRVFPHMQMSRRDGQLALPMSLRNSFPPQTPRLPKLLCLLQNPRLVAGAGGEKLALPYWRAASAGGREGRIAEPAETAYPGQPGRGWFFLPRSFIFDLFPAGVWGDAPSSLASRALCSPRCPPPPPPPPAAVGDFCVGKEEKEKERARARPERASGFPPPRARLSFWLRLLLPMERTL